MSYRNRLQPWCIIRHQPGTEGFVTGRFRHRRDADARLKLLTSSDVRATYSIMFDPKGLLETNSTVTAEFSATGAAD